MATSKECMVYLMYPKIIKLLSITLLYFKHVYKSNNFFEGALTYVIHLNDLEVFARKADLYI